MTTALHHHYKVIVNGADKCITPDWMDANRQFDSAAIDAPNANIVIMEEKFSGHDLIEFNVVKRRFR